MAEVYLYNLLLSDNIGGYVGSTFHSKNRYSYYLKRRHKGQKLFFRHTEKYGFDNFQKITISFPNDISDKELRTWEAFYIKLFGTYFYDNKEYGLNLIKDPTLSIAKDLNVKNKISKALKGKKHTKETIEKIKISTKDLNKGVKRPYLSERNKIYKPFLNKTGELAPRSRKVDLLDDVGNIIKTFSSAKEAGESINSSSERIQYVCNKKTQTRQGYIFRWHLKI